MENIFIFKTIENKNIKIFFKRPLLIHCTKVDGHGLRLSIVTTEETLKRLYTITDMDAILAQEPLEMVRVINEDLCAKIESHSNLVSLIYDLILDIAPKKRYSEVIFENGEVKELRSF